MRRGIATTSQTRGRECNNQLDKRLVERQYGRQWLNVRRGHATVTRYNGAGRRRNNQPWAGEAMEGGGRRVAG
jgi:hypothetical protein